MIRLTVEWDADRIDGSPADAYLAQVLHVKLKHPEAATMVRLEVCDENGIPIAKPAEYPIKDTDYAQ